MLDLGLMAFPTFPTLSSLPYVVIFLMLEET